MTKGRTKFNKLFWTHTVTECNHERLRPNQLLVFTAFFFYQTCKGTGVQKREGSSTLLFTVDLVWTMAVVWFGQWLWFGLDYDYGWLTTLQASKISLFQPPFMNHVFARPLQATYHRITHGNIRYTYGRYRPWRQN